MHKVQYYNVRGKKILKSSSKYYATDLGLLSSKIGFVNENIG
ncbi:hypothetical protein FACS189496_5570 [Bacilli bacterium]|nr:hypothetical protein FACS189496_5570 [Bacilli bacterium]